MRREWTRRLRKARKATEAAGELFAFSTATLCSIVHGWRLHGRTHHGPMMHWFNAVAAALALPVTIDQARTRLAWTASRLAEARQFLESAPSAEAEEQLREAGERLASVMARLEDVADKIDAWFEAAGTTARPAAHTSAEEPPAPVDLAPLRLFLRHHRLRASDRLRILQRRRFRRNRLADAPRRIIRGRAPPAALTCAL